MNASRGRRILVVGGGFAGAYCARRIARALRHQPEQVLLIDRHNYFVFYPLLIEAGSGTLEPRHAIIALRPFLRDADFRMARVRGIDVAHRRVTAELPGGGVSEIDYDLLVLAVGSVTRLPPVAGLREHGFELKTLGDAVHLRNRAIALLEQADTLANPHDRAARLHFVIVGGNYTGVELAGELIGFVRGAARRYRNVQPHEIRVTLVEMQPRILPTLDDQLARYAAESLQHCGVELRLEDSVTEITPTSATLKSGPELPTHTVVWCAGVAPSPLLAQLDLPRDERGYVRTDPDLRVVGHPEIWALGDCAANPDPNGVPYPATAQHATRQGRHAADDIVRVLSGQPTRPFVYEDKGSLAPLGCKRGVARVLRMNFSGRFAWWLHRTYYLLAMPGLLRKVRLASDWTLELLFPKEHVQLDLRIAREQDRGPHSS